MASQDKNKIFTKAELKSNNDITTTDIINSIQLLQPGENKLPITDPASAGQLFITGSDGMNLGGITGSGFAVLCVSQG
jgi:hypothetical protein